MRRARVQQHHGRQTPGEHPVVDERYWRDAILQREYYKPDVGFDRYRWALHFGQIERKRLGANVQFTEVMKDLEAGWKKYGGPSGLTWDEARAAVSDSWERTGTLHAENIAAHGGFKSPPTFSEHGSAVPRNIDEPNS